MFEYKILFHDVNAVGIPIERITDGTNGWSYLQDALLDLGAGGWEVVYAWRNDYKTKAMTPVGLREDVVTERELLLKREVNPVRGWMDRLFNR